MYNKIFNTLEKSPKRRVRLNPEEIKKELEKPRINTDIANPTDPFILTPRNKK